MRSRSKAGSNSTSGRRAVNPFQPAAEVVADSDSSEKKIDTGGAWEPLRLAIFRWFWIASIVSNMGTWVHEVGASWLMTELQATPQMVSAVRIALAIPMMLLAIPAGIIADRITRRTLLLMTQWTLMVIAAVLAMATGVGWIESWSLLGLTFLTGMAMVFHVLAWQATIPLLVPKTQLPRAVALGSISFNLARTLGPAAGGLMIAWAGTWTTFAFNALSFTGVIGVLTFWRPESEPPREPEHFRKSLRDGLRFAATVRPMRNTLIRLAIFIVPASVLYSLLPLMVCRQLGWDERGYGFLVTMIGLGAITAAFAIHRMHAWLSMGKTAALTTAIYGLAALMLSTTLYEPAWVASAFVAGAAWMMTLTTLNSVTQLVLPNRLRGRGMSLYYATMAFSMALGAFLWGQVAGMIGLSPALMISATMLFVGAVAAVRLPLDVKDVDAAWSND
ncbi:MAG: MFS transporter [Planctomycetota bacterium]